MTHQRIEICGGIASGKTTYAGLVAEVSSLVATYEDFRSNPFYSAFYRSPQTYAFETEVTFLLQHFVQIRNQLSNHQQGIFDFSILQDLGYADVNLSGAEYDAFDQVSKVALDKIGTPHILVHLTCPPEVELERIIDRSREEEVSVKVDYLAALNTAVVHRIESMDYHGHLIEIDSAKVDFKKGGRDRQLAEQEIIEALRNMKFSTEAA